MKKALIITFVVIGILIGIFLAAHLTTNAPIGSLYPTDLLEVRQDLIKDYVNEQSLYQAKIASLYKDIENVQKQNEDIINKAKLSDLENLKNKIGLSEISGSGIEITLDDAENVSRDMTYSSDKNFVKASDLRDIVNLLFANRAEAVAINGQRIIATTPISSAGNNILVNNIYMVPPISITAIVDSRLIDARLQDSYTLTDLKIRIANQEIQFVILAKQLLSIPIYSGDFRIKYITASP
ncbi:MAG: hypothetical protein US89_C0001G0015 [Candidatus Peregrinibacteria bacterium GW2011_GWF2_38_29]|nr:MAG: hypothetical protein US89_C0001G0015 [Candidatus Peregrinibacteria bacterium GW2011_GWF2_38_29]HBB03050.1 hypothetical protein [Candidatus Peregrinibacteria bacterium]